MYLLQLAQQIFMQKTWARANDVDSHVTKRHQPSLHPASCLEKDMYIYIYLYHVYIYVFSCLHVAVCHSNEINSKCVSFAIRFLFFTLLWPSSWCAWMVMKLAGLITLRFLCPVLFFPFNFLTCKWLLISSFVYNNTGVDRTFNNRKL